MTMQVTDPFYFEGKEYIFLGAENINDFFDPEKFGLYPEEPITSCWKGFIIHLAVENKKLILKELEVNTKNQVYPDINGVSAKEGFIFHMYSDLNLELKYTGTVVVGGGERKPIYRYSAFIGPEHYEKTLDLIFDNGTLVSWNNSSGKYRGILELTKEEIEKIHSKK